MLKLIPTILLFIFVTISPAFGDQLVIREWKGKKKGGVYSYSIQVDNCKAALKERLDHGEQVKLPSNWLRNRFENILFTCFNDSGIKKSEGWASSIPYKNGKQCIIDTVWGGWVLRESCQYSIITMRAYISEDKPFKDTL